MPAHRYLHSFPTRRSSDLLGVVPSDAFAANGAPPEAVRVGLGGPITRTQVERDRKSTRPELQSCPPTDIYTLSLHDALPIFLASFQATPSQRMARRPKRCASDWAGQLRALRSSAIGRAHVLNSSHARPPIFTLFPYTTLFRSSWRRSKRRLRSEWRAARSGARRTGRANYAHSGRA